MNNSVAFPTVRQIQGLNRVKSLNRIGYSCDSEPEERLDFVENEKERGGFRI